MHYRYPNSVVLFGAAVLLGVLGLALVLAPGDSGAQAADPPAPAPPSLGPYILIGFNDLGMHCSNKSFADLAVLPPYNTFWSVLIKRGDATHAPQVMGPGYSVTYAIEGNTYSVGKTDFWTYALPLFGVSLPDNVGLTGKGLTGAMDWTADHFEAKGVPVTPFLDVDLLHEQPYQLGDLQAFDNLNNLVASTQIVVPVSNEMTCNGCHSHQPGETTEHAILRLHDSEEGTTLVAERPVLCARCHASNALGLPGQPGLPSLSLAMHEHHSEETNDCYKCHPGPNTQCLRDVMSQQFGLSCQSCHGNTNNVAQTISDGRQPWLQEPRCGTCHGSTYSELPNTLYRNSNNGHGGLYCETCHNSPHAIVPSREERDNRQNIALQGYSGTLRQCTVCHGVTPASPGPHGYYPSGLQDPVTAGRWEVRLSAAPNPLEQSAEISYRVADSSPVRLTIHDVSGRDVKVLTTRPQTPGDHTLVWDGTDRDSRPVPAGVYFARIENGGQTASLRLVKVGR